MNTGKYWSKQEELELMDRMSEKMPVNEIARLHGRTAKAIEMRLEYLIRKQFKENYTISSLMNLYNKTEKQIREILEKEPQQAQEKENHTLYDRIALIEKKLETIEKYVSRIYKILSKN